MSDDAPTPPALVAVVGAGTMGAGIALCFALAGSSVVVSSRRRETRERAVRQIDASSTQLVAHEAIAPKAARAARERIQLLADAEAAVAEADLVIESVVEDLAVKIDLLGRLEDAAPESAVLTTNTSSLSLRAIAGALRRPGRFAAFHWFNPAELVPLVEVVAADATAPETMDRIVGWAEAAGKAPVRLEREVAGFVANRLQYAVMREAYALVEAGVCDHAAVDTAVSAGIGARWAAIGPFETMDLAGLDIHESVCRELFPKLSTAREPPAQLIEAVRDGRLGVKSGDGLRGPYDRNAIQRLTDRRAATLLTLGRHVAGRS